MVSPLLRKALSRRALFFICAGIFAWIATLVLAGISDSISASVRGLKGLGFALGISAVCLAFRATSWKIALSVCGRSRAPLAVVLKSSLGAGGTPIRLALLKMRTGIADGAGSVAMDRSVSAIASLTFIFSGLFLGFLFPPGDVFVRGLMLIIAVGGAGYVAIAVKRGRRKRYGWHLSLLKCCNSIARRFVSPAVYGCFEERDRFLAFLRAKGGAAFAASFLVHMTAYALAAAEVFAIGRAIDSEFPGPLAVGLAAAIQSFRWISLPPAAFGFLEAFVSLLLVLLFGLPLAPVGFALMTVLRLKSLILWIVGLSMNGNPVKILLSR